MEDQLARIAIEDAGGECLDVDDGAIEPEHRRDAEGAGEDRGVGVDTAELGGKAEDVPPVHRRRVGRGKVVGHENMLLLGQLMPGLTTFGAEIPQHALANVFDVGRAFAEC